MQLYSLSSLLLNICKLDGTCQQTAKCKLKNILLQDLQDHNNKGLQSLKEYTILVDIIALMNTILNKSSTYPEFDKLFVEKIHIALILPKFPMILTMAFWETLIPKKRSF